MRTAYYPKTRKTIPSYPNVSQYAKNHPGTRCISIREKPSRDTMCPKTPKTVPGHNVSQYGKNHLETPYVLTREKPSRDATCPRHGRVRPKTPCVSRWVNSRLLYKKCPGMAKSELVRRNCHAKDACTCPCAHQPADSHRRRTGAPGAPAYSTSPPRPRLLETLCSFNTRTAAEHAPKTR